MSVFREAERRYMAGGRQLGRIATVGADGTPHVVPVAWIFNAARDTIDVGGHELERSKKFRDIARSGSLVAEHAILSLTLGWAVVMVLVAASEARRYRRAPHGTDRVVHDTGL